jgi:hypothetical protein
MMMREIEVTADAVFADLPDGGVVVHTGTKRYYSLNQTGARIWGLLEHSGSLAAAASTIAAEYGISIEEANHAVTELTEGLLAAGLVRRALGGEV